ncbi:MAG: DUF4013 domain-containing protein [Anaerolineales bacterium]|nr:DUF4013 domain-containing protein [Anaerolineales bacterium]
MFFGFDLKEILLFPVKDEQARKYFLVGCLVALAGFFIPILPYLALFGYAVQIARQTLRGEAPRMIPWEDWGGMLKDGLKLFGIRMIYSIPILIIAIPLMLAGIAMPLIVENLDSSNIDAFLTIFTIVMFGGMCVLIPLSIPLALLIPVAEMHYIEKNDFAASFRIKEWWQILRSNLSGFIAAFGIYYATSFILTFVIQIIAATLILACLMFILIPALTVYISLIIYVTVAIAYRSGQEKLAAPTNVESAA